MIISRRPKMRASSENAPGPRHTRAARITVAKTAVSLASNKSTLGAGNHESVSQPHLPVFVASKETDQDVRINGPHGVS